MDTSSSPATLVALKVDEDDAADVVPGPPRDLVLASGSLRACSFFAAGRCRDGAHCRNSHLCGDSVGLQRIEIERVRNCLAGHFQISFANVAGVMCERTVRRYDFDKVLVLPVDAANKREIDAMSAADHDSYGKSEVDLITKASEEFMSTAGEDFRLIEFRRYLEGKLGSVPDRNWYRFKAIFTDLLRKESSRDVQISTDAAVIVSSDSDVDENEWAAEREVEDDRRSRARVAHFLTLDKYMQFGNDRT